ncbi:hypothetical protein BADSM9389_32330 [Buttiauxella agrestis]|nr:hypothetical protein BADSM9389_32330 [Buttiauxella agrestis]
MHEAKLQIYVIQITGFIGGMVGRLSYFLRQDVTKNADVTEAYPHGREGCGVYCAGNACEGSTG